MDSKRNTDVLAHDTSICCSQIVVMYFVIQVSCLLKLFLSMSLNQTYRYDHKQKVTCPPDDVSAMASSLMNIHDPGVCLVKSNRLAIDLPFEFGSSVGEASLRFSLFAAALPTDSRSRSTFPSTSSRGLDDGWGAHLGSLEG